MECVGTFLTDVASGTLSGIFVGAVVLGVGYWLIDRRVHIRDALARQSEREVQTEHNRRVALEAMHVELESNARALMLALKTLPAGRFSYPLFDTTTLALAFQPVIFTTLGTTTVKALLHVFNRMETANDQHAFVFDLRHGPTVILTTMIEAGTAETEKTRKATQNFLAHRETMSAALLQRCQNLRPHLYAAIDAVEAELKLEPITRAADRSYVSDDAIGLVGH